MSRFVLAIIIVAVAAFGAGFTGLNGDFVWDDISLLVLKPIYRNFDLRTIFLSPANGVEYLPLRDISYAVDMKLWGIMYPYGFHLTNLILYSLNAVTVFLVSREIMMHLSTDRNTVRPEPSDIYAALLASLLFVVHPIHSEVVAFVTQRNTLLAGLFFFLSLWCYLRYLRGSQSYGWYAASLFAFILSLLSKGFGIILPLVLLLCVTVFARRGKFRLGGILELAPFMAISTLFFFLFTTIARSTHVMIYQPGDPSFGGKIAIALQIPFFYVEKLLYPMSLAPEYDTIFAESTLSLRVALCGLILILLAVAAFKWRRTFPALLFCYGWFLLTLLPVLNLFPTNPVVADRYAFIPSLAPCLLAASLLSFITQRKRRMLFLIICSAGIIGLFSVMAAQNRIWRSETELWSHAVEVSPRSARSYENLSRELYASGNIIGAIEMARTALAINPRGSQYDFLMGTLFVIKDDIPSAINAFTRSVNRNPLFVEGYYHLAKLYERTGLFSEAADAYRRLLASPGVDEGGYREKAVSGLRQLSERGD